MYTPLSQFLWSASFGLFLGLAISVAGIYYERLRKIREDKRVEAQREFDRRLTACETILSLQGDGK